MGQLHKTASSTSSVRLTTTASSSAPSLTKKIFVRTTGLLAIVSVVGISSAAEPDGKGQTSSSKDAHKATSIHLDSKSGETTENASGNVGSGDAFNSSRSSYNVTVNDQPIAVPENGTNEEVITTPDSTTTVTVHNSTSSQGSSFSANSTTTSTNTQGAGINQHTVIEQDHGSPYP